MNSGRMSAIIKKDISSVTSSAQMWLPMIVVPLVFMILIPLGVTIMGRTLRIEDLNNAGMVEQFLTQAPFPELQKELAAFPDLMQKAVYVFANYLFAPMFLIVPVMVATIISGGGFAGEKEKKTLESLLYTPITEKELFFSKTAAAFFPSLVVSAVGFVLYGAVLNAFGYPLFGRLFFPSWSWLPFMLLVVPGVSILAIGVTVIVSAKVRGFQEAQQISVLIILPIFLLVVTQAVGVFFLSAAVCAALGALLLIADYFIISRAAKGFDREKLLKNYAGK
jgi:ABC-2 type transport system permease protein